MTSIKAKAEAEKTHYRNILRDKLTPGTTVYTSLEHVSRSGMSRRISAYIVTGDEIEDITWLIHRSGGGRLHANGGIVMGGCGMDMGFSLVYNVGRMLYPAGFECTGSNGWTPTGKRSKRPRCMSNDHVNTPATPYRKGRKHKGDGGYALNQAWL